jgi:hypothetical protein
MSIIDWNPADGDLCQGDVLIFRIPDSLALSTADEVKPRDHRLILAEGEVTGHHHAIWMPQPVMFRDDGLARDLALGLEADRQAVAARFIEGKPTGMVYLYRDPDAVRQLERLGEITHGRLAIGFLVVEGAPVILRHDEHDAVRIPVGRYYVGGQSEWDAAEERRVAD